MKLSKPTIEILKNFASINANILIKQGKKLSTLAVAKNIMATVDVEENFTTEVGIFNLPEFLSVLSLMDEPEIDLDTKFMTLKEGKTKMRYTYADASILTYPQKDLKMPSADVSFELSAAQLNNIQRAAAAMGVQDVAVVGDGKDLVIQVLDKKNDSSNQYTIDLNTKTSDEFKVFFKVENFKQMPDDYTVELSKKNISRFVGGKNKITYFIAIEQDSEWK